MDTANLILHCTVYIAFQNTTLAIIYISKLVHLLLHSVGGLTKDNQDRPKCLKWKQKRESRLCPHYKMMDSYIFLYVSSIYQQTGMPASRCHAFIL